MGCEGDEPQGGVWPTLKPVAHGECSQPSRGTDASAGPLPELWQRVHSGFRLLPQLSGTFTAGQADRACSDRRDPGPRRSRRGRVRGVVDGRDRAQTRRESGRRELLPELSEPIAGRRAERGRDDAFPANRRRDDSVTGDCAIGATVGVTGLVNQPCGSGPTVYGRFVTFADRRPR